MKTLILMRHAKTEQLDYHSSKSDFERTLLPRGVKDCKLVANELLQQGVSIDKIVSSEAYRAKETAKEMAGHLSLSPDSIDYCPFIYDGYTTQQLLGFLERYTENAIMIVGHNPEIAMLAMNLATDTSFYHYPTSAAAVIDFDVDTWGKVEARLGKTRLFTFPSMLK